MARTTEEIRASLEDLKNANPLLVVLQGTQAGLYWDNLLDIIAAALSTFETNWDNFKELLKREKAAEDVGGEGWYAAKALLYQDGDTPTRTGIDKPYTYDTIDESKRIISFVSTSENETDRSITLRVAKDAGGGIPEALTGTELTNFNGYLANYVKRVGIGLSATSAAADDVRLTGTLIVVNGFDLATIKSNVETAINNYLNTSDGKLIFGGKVLVSEILETALGVEGVADLQLTLKEGRPNGGVYASFDFEYITVAGYASLQEWDANITAQFES